MADTETPINATQILIRSHTSTDGSISPKARWVRGPPEAYSEQQEQKTSAQDQSSVDPAPSDLPALQQIHDNRKSYMAWSWLLEDEAEREPSLCKPTDMAALRMPQLAGDERELLCEKVARRLVEVSCNSVPLRCLALLRFCL